MNPFATDRLWKVLAGVTFLALATFEAINDLNGVARAGFLERYNRVGLLLVPLWALSGALLLMDRPRSWQRNVVAAGILAAVAHGAALRIGRTTADGVSGGAIFIVAAVAVVVLLSPFIRDWLAVRDLVAPRGKHAQ